MDTSIDTEIFTRDEAARYLKVSRTFLDMVGTKGPRFSYVGRHTCYQKCDLLDWLKQNINDKK